MFFIDDIFDGIYTYNNSGLFPSIYILCIFTAFIFIQFLKISSTLITRKISSTLISNPLTIRFSLENHNTQYC
jgi:hypothetical protein